MNQVKKVLSTLFLNFLLASSVLADNIPLNGLKKLQPETGFRPESNNYALGAIIGSFVNIFLSVLGIIFVILMLYAGYTWMMAQDEEKKVTNAKDTIRRAIIGLIITVSVYAIWNIIADRILSISLN